MDSAEVGGVIASFVPILILALITVPAYWIIWKRTGSSPWWSLLMFFRLLNVAFAWFLALKRWPAVDDQIKVSERFE